MTARVQFDTDTGGATLRIGIFNEFDGQRSEMAFSSFPVRIGRNRRNDLVLLHEYVSQWHAVIGFVSGQLCIVQVGSSNSARVNGRKLVPNELQPLQGGEEIRVVPFRLQTTVAGPTDAVTHRMDASQHREAPGHSLVDAPFPPVSLPHQGPESQIPLPAPMSGYPTGQQPGSLPTGPQLGVRPTGPLPGPEPTGPFPGQDPSAAHRGLGSFVSQAPPAPRHLQASTTGAMYTDGTPSGGEAFAVLNRLSEYYWGRPLQNGQEAAYLGARLEMVFGKLLDGVFSLRNGQLLFLQEMNIKQLGENVVDQLESPHQLGAALLAGQDPRVDPALEDTFERLKLHQVALLRGVEAGVKFLMRKLAPGAVEKQVRSNNTRSLWDYFCQLHGDLEEGQAIFKLLYGAQFKKAYSKLVNGTKKQTG